MLHRLLPTGRAFVTLMALSLTTGVELPAQPPLPPADPGHVLPVEELPAPTIALPPPVEWQSEPWSVQPQEGVPGGMALWSLPAPHLVLRPHGPSRPHAHRRSPLPSHVGSHRENVTGPQPALPGATTLQLQKTPYAYGYFGAIGRRHWSLHYGHQQNYTQWTKR